MIARGEEQDVAHARLLDDDLRRLDGHDAPTFDVLADLAEAKLVDDLVPEERLAGRDHDGVRAERRVRGERHRLGGLRRRRFVGEERVRHAEECEEGGTH